MNGLVEVPEYELQAEVRVDPARTALVVVDMQNDFVHQGGGLLVPDAEATIPAIRSLLELARARPRGQLGLGDRRGAHADARRSRPAQTPLRRVLRHAPRSPAAALGR